MPSSAAQKMEPSRVPVFCRYWVGRRQDEAIGFVPLIGAELARSGKMKPIIWYSSIGCLRRTYTPDNLVFLRRLFAETDCPPNLISLPGLMREPQGRQYSVLLRPLWKPHTGSILIPHDERLRVRRSGGRPTISVPFRSLRKQRRGRPNTP